MNAVVAFPQPKYRVGDAVFYATTTTTAAKHDCPDCMGARTWTATSPAGNTIEMDCPRCTRGWHDRNLDLSYTKSVPYVRKLTIGSVRMDTNEEEPFSYMCVETGVGSGSVYRESMLHAEQSQADVVCAQMCAEEQAKLSAEPRAIEQRMYVDLFYIDAVKKSLSADIEQRIRARIASEIEGEVAIGNFAPGEWAAEIDGDEGGEVRFNIRAYDAGNEADYGKTVCSGYSGYSNVVDSKFVAGNALLIAAAPRLLLALEALSDGEEGAETLARAAIAKARGDT